jgi:hypothetical protein
MTRRYDDPVDVRRRDDAPAEFLWRGRLYVVREVLAHWVETGAWWRAAVVRAAYVGTNDAGDAGAGDAGAGDAHAGAGAGAGAAAPATLSLTATAEREMWRVEASAGRVRGSGVFDLCFDWGAGMWTLARALD